MPKVIVIGLDGATFTLLNPWMDLGYLPHLRAIRDQGVWGPLQSCVPPVTAPAWQCFMTGKNPGKHGVYFFLRRKPQSYDEVPVLSLHGRTLWELLSDAGKRVLVLNVPFTYPPPQVNGVVIGGFTSPSYERKDFCYPQALLAEIEQRFGPYRLYLNTPPVIAVHRLQGGFERLLKDCLAITEYQFEVAKFLLGRDSYDFAMVYQFTTDRIQHWLWHVLDPSEPSFHSAESARYREDVLKYYGTLDECIGRLIETCGDDAHVIVMSDHGFGSVHKLIDLNVWLLKEGYIHIKQDVVSQLKLLLWRCGWTPETVARSIINNLTKSQAIQQFIVKMLPSKERRRRKQRTGAERLLNSLFLSKHDIDWSRTQAYCCNTYGQIRINLMGREPQGCVRPGTDYELLRDEIAAKLRALLDPESGAPVHGAVFLRDEIYRGRYAADLPDITFLPLENRYAAGHVVGFTSNTVFTHANFHASGAYGSHRMDGILMAKGKHFKAGQTLAGANIVDLAPTILYLLGSTIPADMDGKVLAGLFDEDFLNRHPIEYGASPPEGDGTNFDMSEEDQQAIIQRLQGLGYL